MKQFIVFIFLTAFLISCSEKKYITVKELRLLEQKISLHNFKASNEYQSCVDQLRNHLWIMCGIRAHLLGDEIRKYHQDIQWTEYNIRYDTAVNLEKWLTWCENNNYDPINDSEKLLDMKVYMTE